MLRTFVAVEVGQDVKAKAAKIIKQLDTTQARVKWVDPLQLHFTMKFLGEVDVRQIAEICSILNAAVAELPAFEIEVQGLGAFPSVESPRTIWLGVNEGHEAMVALHQAAEEALSPLGFRVENRRFRPHLTIGRVRNSPDGIPELAQLLKTHADYQAGNSIVEDLAVISSRLHSYGPEHEALGYASLAQNLP